MKRFIFAAIGLALAASAGLAASTINPAVPAANSPMVSAPVRANFQAAVTDINNILNAYSGSSAPSAPTTYQFWMNSSGQPRILDMYDGAQWVQIGTLNSSTHTWIPGTLAIPVTVPQGGTGLTSGTSGGIPYFSSSTSIASSAALSASQIVLGGGAGAAPTSLSLGTTTTVLHGNASGPPSWASVAIATDVSGLGSGLPTALGINPGTAGSVVLNGGALGTPTSGTLTNATGLPVSTGISGLGTGVATLLAATPSGSAALVGKTSPTISALTVTGSLTATGLVTVADLVSPSTTVNGTTCTLGSTCTISTLAVPTRQVLLSGTGATYTTPANVRQLRITMVGGGGGGGGSGTGAGGGNGGTGGTTTFNSINAVGGGGGSGGGVGGIGGTGGTGSASLRIAGQPGSNAFSEGGNFQGAAPGGASLLGPGAPNNTAALANSGGGGGAASVNAVSGQGGGSGGAGEFVQIIINSPSGTYTYTIGAGGTAGTIGTSGGVGSVGGSGIIIVEELY